MYCLEKIPLLDDQTETNKILSQVIKSDILTDDALLMLKDSVSQVNE